MREVLPVIATFEQPDALARLCALIGEQTGLALTPAHWGDLQRAIVIVTEEFGFTDAGACLEGLLAPLNARPLQVLIDNLTIGETYFFRDKAMYAALRELLLPPLIESRRSSGKHLRIWCAASSTGEEPYSIAIEVARALPDLSRWNINIVATDINQRFLRKAESGIYDRWSFRNTSPEQREPYIQTTAEGRFVVAPAIKSMVRFFNLNLMENRYPSPLNATTDVDILFCRNVLMYLRPESAEAVIKRLCDALVEGGWLIVSSVEATLVNLPHMIPVRLPDLMAFRKDTHHALNAKSAAQSLARKQIGRVADNNDIPLLARTKMPAVNDKKIQAKALENKIAKNKLQLSQAIFSRAQQFYQARQYTEAEFVLIDNLDDFAADDNLRKNIYPQALLLLAKIYANQGRFAEALQHCEHAVAIDKLNPAAHYLLASILIETNATLIKTQSSALADTNAAAAEEALKRTLYLDSGWIMAYIALGRLLASQPARLGDAKRYIGHARTLLKNNPVQQLVPESDGLTADQLLQMLKIIVADEVS
ncbi:MAG: methyltransferase, CheR-type [Verrucomicrobiaceae bacterium]|nr:methyltransferase, CheR-type [Verrucomicrobiaceae bacterium]